MYYLVFLYISCYIAEIWIAFVTVYNGWACLITLNAPDNGRTCLTSSYVPDTLLSCLTTQQNLNCGEHMCPSE